MDVVELTKKLCMLAGPSGYEGAVSAYVAEYLQAKADCVETDCMGNVIAVKKCGQPDAKRLVLSAHMDECGLILTRQTGSFYTVHPLGEVDPSCLPAAELRILGDNNWLGVVAVMPPHLLKSEEQGKNIPWDKLYVDTGFDEGNMPASLGPSTSAVFDGLCDELTPGVLCGKALHSRSALALALHVFELMCARELNLDLYCLLTVQGELHARGAAAGCHAISPDDALILDTMRTSDSKTPACGTGPAIAFGPLMNRTLSSALKTLAEEKELPHSVFVLADSQNAGDTAAIQTAREGIRTAYLCLPMLHRGSGAEILYADDLTAAQRLLCEYILKAGEGNELA